MSYLPRMSKTYKEPPLPVPEEPNENTSSSSLKPASSLLNEKTYNPQIVLRHYGYLPHPPPVLPGPSVLDEAIENELFREMSRMRRSMSKMETLSKVSETISEQQSVETIESILEENESKPDVVEKVKRTHSKKVVKGSKPSLGRKRSSKTVKKENYSNITVNTCLTTEDKPFTATGVITKPQNMVQDSEFLTGDELESLKREKTIFQVPTGDVCVKPENEIKKRKEPVAEPGDKQRGFINRSVQCTIFGNVCRVFVIPPIINSLLRTLAFLLHEINKEDAVLSSSTGEKKFPMTQIQLILGDLCNQKVEKYFGFDVTYSDCKRLEKILVEFQKYMRDVYGDKGEYIDKMEDLKRVFIEAKTKEMELTLLNEKLQDKEEKEPEEIVVKKEDLVNPEITLQNKRLESEQLMAEVEFSYRELKKYQKTIAELEWDIKKCQEQMVSLKKSSKSKTEVLGRKISVHKFSNETLARNNKSKDNESSSKKKT